MKKILTTFLIILLSVVLISMSNADDTPSVIRFSVNKENELESNSVIISGSYDVQTGKLILVDVSTVDAQVFSFEIRQLGGTYYDGNIVDLDSPENDRTFTLPSSEATYQIEVEFDNTTGGVYTGTLTLPYTAVIRYQYDPAGNRTKRKSVEIND